MRQISGILLLISSINYGISLSTVNYTAKLHPIRTNKAFIRQPVKQLHIVHGKLTNAAILKDICPEGVCENINYLAKNLNVTKCAEFAYNLGTSVKKFIPRKLLNSNIPFQSFIYYSNLSIYLADFFIFDGLIAGLFELRGNALAIHEEFYRILTSLFIHRDWPHLAMNLLSFSVIAPMVTKALGPWKALTIYLLSGIIANYVTYVYHMLHDKGVPIEGEFDDGRFDPVVDISKKYYEAIQQFKALPFPLYLLLHLKNLITRFFFRKSRASPLKINQVLHSFSSHGASGAIYGLHGAYMLYRWNKEGIMAIPTGFLLPNRIWELVLSTILNSLGETRRDTVAHVSGFIAGILLGSVAKLYN